MSEPLLYSWLSQSLAPTQALSSAEDATVTWHRLAGAIASGSQDILILSSSITGSVQSIGDKRYVLTYPPGNQGINLSVTLTGNLELLADDGQTIQFSNVDVDYSRTWVLSADRNVSSGLEFTRATNTGFFTTPTLSIQDRKVGIGTASPQASLQIGTYFDSIAEPTYSGSIKLVGYQNSLQSNGGIEFKSSNTGAGDGCKIQSIIAADGGPALVLGNRVNSATWTELARISYLGKLGIGTQAPVSLLDVRGQIAGGFGGITTGGVANWNDVTNARSGNGQSLLLGNASNGPGYNGYFHVFNFEYSSYDGSGNITQLAIPYGLAGSSIDAGLYFRGYYSGIGWSSWCRIICTNTSGRVGIGTTAPTSILHVVNLPAYSTNAAAVTAGLTSGSFYRNGDNLCVVH
jgi:hypothetical protein